MHFRFCVFGLLYLTTGTWKELNVPSSWKNTGSSVEAGHGGRFHAERKRGSYRTSAMDQNPTVHLHHSSLEKQAHWSGPGTFCNSAFLKRKETNQKFKYCVLLCKLMQELGISTTWKWMTCTWLNLDVCL